MEKVNKLIPFALRNLLENLILCPINFVEASLYLFLYSIKLKEIKIHIYIE